ncbi:MAG: ABC transporter permease [Planctomycetes bacterium]|nr:ABC transporter permease [Planctomycetota bacterium]
MSSDSRPAITFERFGIGFSTPTGERVILESVDLSVEAGKLYLLIGESGSGKSTILRLIAGLWDTREPLPRMRGKARVLGESVRGSYPETLRGRVQAVLQDEGLLDELSPRANVELGLQRAGRSKRLALGLLSQAGLDQPPANVAELSGGMRKRLAVARAMAGDPAVLVFDEPTAGLDGDSAREIAELIRSTQRSAGSARTTIVITHDLAAFEGLADSVLQLDHRQRTLRLRNPDDPVEDGDESTRGVEPAPADSEVGLHGVRRFLLSFAALATTVGEAFTRAIPVYPAIVIRAIGRYTLEPVFFIVVGCATVGGLATFFALRNNPLEGAFVASVLTGSGKVLVSVLIPLLAGFFFTARVAAGAAARLGTMKRTSQVAALRVIGIRPADYLLVPMVWACVIAMPVATFCGLVMMSVFSCGAAILVAGSTPLGWARAFFAEVDVSDLRFVLSKTVLSGLLIAIQTYHLAMGPKRSGRDVGQSVNSAIVLGIYTVLAVHAVLTLLQFG